MMLSVVELKEKSGLPEEFCGLLPERCERCGTDLWISEALTGLHCGNPRCGDKLAMRMRAMCEDLSILGMGEKNLNKFIDLYNPTNPLDLLSLPAGEGYPYWEGAGEEVTQRIYVQVVRELGKPRELQEVVRLCHIPGLQTQAKKLLEGYVYIEEFFRDLEEGGVLWVQERLGIAGGEDGVSLNSVKLYENLVEYKEDIIEACGMFQILGQEGVGESEDGVSWNEIPEVTVVISDSPGGRWAKKRDFMEEMQEKFAGKARISFLGSVNRGIDVLVWAGADGSPARYTSKVKAVEGYQDKGYDVKLLTGEGFEEWMEERFS